MYTCQLHMSSLFLWFMCLLCMHGIRHRCSCVVMNTCQLHMYFVCMHVVYMFIMHALYLVGVIVVTSCMVTRIMIEMMSVY